MGKYTYSIGDKFNRLTIIEVTEERTKAGAVKLKCVCECKDKKIIFVTIYNLVSGNTKSCGCLVREILVERSTTHGMRHTPEWHVWAQMIGRCTNVNNKGYKNYGERGISIEDSRWFDFSCFIQDMGKRPAPGLSLERRDNSRGYSKENCYYADRFQQSRNRRNVHKILHNGEIKSVAEWCQILSLKPSPIYHRISRGMEPQAAFDKSILQLGTLDLNILDGNPCPIECS